MGIGPGRTGPLVTPTPGRRSVSLPGVSVPDGSCAGTGARALEESIDFDQKGRKTGVCPVCLGRFRVSDGLLPNHAPSPNLETMLGGT